MMGDALCGPSNALQSFQKHASADRTLQQDRLTLRQRPSQGFRSSPGVNGGVLDPEFDSFQANFGGEPPQAAIHHPFDGSTANAINIAFQASASQPNWAADFQRLNLSSPPPPFQQSQKFPTQSYLPQMSAVAGSSKWHQDFMSSMPPIANSPQPSAQSVAMFGRSGYIPAFQPVDPFLSQNAGQGVTKDQLVSPGFDEAAFERAFEAAHSDLLDSSSASVEAIPQQQESQMAEGRIPEEANPLMRLTWERQPATYLVVKIWNAFGLSTEGSPFQQDTAQNAAAFLSELELLQENGRLTDEAEILRTKKILNKILQLENVPYKDEYQFVSRARNLLDRVEGRPLMAVDEFGKALGLTEEVESQGDLIREAFQEENEEIAQRPENNDEELARTAAQLLESVSDNTSKKFQESNFLALMRKLRDREVRVEGDKMVETLSQDPSVSNHGHAILSEGDNKFGQASHSDSMAAGDTNIGESHSSDKSPSS